MLRISIAVAVLASPALAQHPVSAPEHVFAPDPFVPLSSFAKKTAGVQLSLEVDLDVLRWIRDEHGLASVKMAVRPPAGPVTYHDTMALLTNGMVTLAGPAAGSCVVVSMGVTQDTDLVTHWSGSNPASGGSCPRAANDGRGRQLTNARDAINTLDFTEVNGVWKIRKLAERTTNGPNPAHHFNTVEFALFSDDSGEPCLEGQDVKPAFERYVAETFSTHKPTALALVALSDAARQRTGLPLRHLNPTTAPTHDLPFFQIVHAHLVDIDGPTIQPDPDYRLTLAGNQNSLVTYVLPPHWSASAAPGTYAVLFEGAYDLHRATFLNSQGIGHLETLGAVFGQGGRQAIGVIWNGGGARGTATFHRSAYDNAYRLLLDAESLFGADRLRVVFTGGSRGGTTALGMASNPYGLDYAAVYVHARNPQVKVGESVATYSNPSYPAAHGVLDETTGYSGSWRNDWMGGGVAVPLSLQSLVGTSSPAMADDPLTGHAIHSTKFIVGQPASTSPTGIGSGLVNSPLFNPSMDEQARIVLRLGTHDHFKAYAQMVEYLDALRAAGLFVRTEIYYRAGHRTFEEDLWGDDDLLVLAVDRGMDATLVDETLHFSPTGPLSTDYCDITLDVEASHIPLTVELPLYVGTGDVSTLSLVGQPGGSATVTLISPTGRPVTFTGTLSGSGTFGTDLISLPSPIVKKLKVWTYRVDYSPPSGGPAAMYTNHYATALAPGALPGDPNVLYLRETEVAGASKRSRTGGVGEDDDFMCNPEPPDPPGSSVRAR